MGSEGSHHTIRMLICDEIMLNTQDYVYFVDLDEDEFPGTYLKEMCTLGSYGGRAELLAAGCETL